ncbi:cobalt ECF transporter T component CbiQ [Alkaliphilus oremlandii]|uniref:Cobalt ABC transporter, inner membrane subunit CbiQ n=1 Tax=Alkaliphilus oremlandii (strain OhILAs) TaxID=350688 RepID=A8MG22_ALKOO|nr:cobalt ECF transporter T component CbiQ [Alkaliphilus oremlandii]ABW18560.1 cobalt ABC transporter, inner membrane subunit CbiQ [Alkaliphilus oremlandii OhILAs]
MLIDKYAYINKLANFNPYIKFTMVAMALAIATIVSNNYVNILILITMSLLTVVVGGIPLNRYIKALLIPLVFLVVSIVSVLISISQKDVYVARIEVLRYYIGFTEESLFQSIHILTRVFACLSATFFLAFTTSINQLIRIFKKLRVPNVVIELLILTYRSIFIFLEEMQEIYRAQEIRFGYSGYRNSFRSTALLMKSLFIRVLQKYEDMVISLECKLYNGEFKIGD